MGILYYTETKSNPKNALKAVSHLKTAIQSERNTTAMFNLAVIFEELGEHQRAKEMYHEVSTLILWHTVQVLKIEPSHYKSKVNSAIILEKEGHTRDAHERYKQVIEEFPNEARVYHNLGINMRRNGMLEGAMDYYKTSLDMEPDNALFQYNLGVLHNFKKEYPKAIDILEKSINNNPDNIYAHLALGDAYEQMKNF